MQVDNPLIVTSSPHIHSGHSISAAMRDVIIALAPAVLASVYFFGINAAFIIIACIVAAVLAEYICQRIMQRKITVTDGSAALTGLLLALCLPPSLPIWIGVLGSFFAIVIGKQVFGGLGCNIFNPAHIGRAILLASFPAHMTTWTMPAVDVVDAISEATPLMKMRELSQSVMPETLMLVMNDSITFQDLFVGNIAGSLGETCVPALLLGGLYLIWRNQIDWRIPLVYIGSVFLIMFIYGVYCGYGTLFSVFHVLSGGLILGAFFMATDWVTGPLTKKGKIVFALGLGFLTCAIRLKSNYVEGVCYSILIMNMLTPLIDRFTKKRIFGRAKK